jgi:hypothetical protein
MVWCHSIGAVCVCCWSPPPSLPLLLLGLGLGLMRLLLLSRDVWGILRAHRDALALALALRGHVEGGVRAPLQAAAGLRLRTAAGSTIEDRGSRIDTTLYGPYVAVPQPAAD